jgi:pimeloyl-ACP methyl ester carboxylesterase
MTANVEFASVRLSHHDSCIEHIWIGRERSHRPLVVFLHEGLGSVSMWKGFPNRLCDALTCRGLVYSRPGYGKSSFPGPAVTWQPDFMHREAYDVLPALLDVLQVGPKEKIWLFGHSDGGSIALLYAARFPDRVAGVVVLAPHILVEDVTVASIAVARHHYSTGTLRSALARHHDDADALFARWSDIWLNPNFRAWSIEAELPAITAPLLAVQGEQDEYGSAEQIRGIARRVPQTCLLELPECGHSPHRDQPERLIGAVQAFFDSHSIEKTNSR